MNSFNLWDVVLSAFALPFPIAIFLEKLDNWVSYKLPTSREFEYIKNRLNQFNTLVKVENRFNSGFWYHEGIKLGFTNTESNGPILEQTAGSKNLQYAD